MKPRAFSDYVVTSANASYHSYREQFSMISSLCNHLVINKFDKFQQKSNQTRLKNISQLIKGHFFYNFEAIKSFY